jgi:hypothetical protein
VSKSQTKTFAVALVSVPLGKKTAITEAVRTLWIHRYGELPDPTWAPTVVKWACRRRHHVIDTRCEDEARLFVEILEAAGAKAKMRRQAYWTDEELHELSVEFAAKQAAKQAQAVAS